MQSIPETEAEQTIAYQELRFRVLATNAGHAVTALFG